METVDRVLKEIKELTGINLTPCGFFTGIKNHNGKSYFNVILNDNVSDSKEYDSLLRLANKNSIIIDVQPNGVKRLAVFYDNKKRLQDVI